MYLSRQQTMALVVLLSLTLVGLGILAWRGVDRGGVTVTMVSEAENAAPPAGGEAKTVVVHVCGAVKNPGVYTLPADARVYQAVEMAGGLLPEADQDAINLAAFLRDGEQIMIPRQGQAAPNRPVRAGGAQEAAGSAAVKVKFPLDLNTATAADLEAVPGIGPSLAGRITDYRQANGPFVSLDDLLNVSGIGERTLEKIKPYLTVP